MTDKLLACGGRGQEGGVLREKWCCISSWDTTGARLVPGLASGPGVQGPRHGQVEPPFLGKELVLT